jgi:hypothetical protein
MSAVLRCACGARCVLPRCRALRARATRLLPTRL